MSLRKILLKFLLLANILLLITGCSKCPIHVDTPIDTMATEETRELLKKLYRISPEHVLFGHQNTQAYGYSWHNEEGRSDVLDATGSFPAIYGQDFHSLDGNQGEVDAYNITADRMVQWIGEADARGGISTISWHMVNPVSLISYNDKTPAARAILPGGERHDFYRSELDRVAGIFKAVSPIPVIFRPFHEHNGDWFWWGKGNISEKDFIALWRFTVEYLRDEKDVHNLLYAFSPDRSRMDPSSEADYLYAYPGDDYVDIMGLDNYYDLASHWNKAPPEQQAKDLVKSLEMVVRLAEKHGKLPALTETGLDTLHIHDWWMNRLYAGLNASETTRRIAYVLVWRNANREIEGRDHFHVPHLDHPGLEDFRAFRNTEQILFEDEQDSQ